MDVDYRFPWPRDPKTFIPEPRFQDDVDDVVRFQSDEFKMRPFTDEWDAYDTMLYNAWLTVDVIRTRFMDQGFLESLGIRDEVMHLWESMGMGTLGVTPYPLYPDLVRQFMATLRIRYREGHLYSAADGELFFKLHGRRYTLSLTEFAGLYGLDTPSDLVSYSETFTDARAFFELIGDARYDSTSNRSMHIRHPVLRYVLKMLGSTIFCKKEINRTRTHELLFLYFGISDRAFPGRGRGEETRPHLGAIFAFHLLSLQGRPLGHLESEESVGSLLTPLFQRFGVLGEATDGIGAVSYLGRSHFVAGHALVGANVWAYYVDKVPRTIQLPSPDHTGISTPEQLAFRQDLVPAPAPRRGLRRHRSPTAASSSAGPSSAPEDGPPDFGLRDSPSPDYDDPDAVLQWEARSDQRTTRALGRIRAWLCGGRDV